MLSIDWTSLDDSVLRVTFSIVSLFSLSFCMRFLRFLYLVHRLINFELRFWYSLCMCIRWC
jgi:hypothetical protein